jgi:oxygen-independent coproporphyrinogen III oxidase
MKRLGLYIHIPFCIEKCRYCDFLSFGGRDTSLHSAYVEALLAEIENANGDGFIVDSIFIGGGTPSLLEAEHICRILNQINLGFTLHPDIEITIESNPKTLTREKLMAYRNMGINRLSIGAQTLNDELLGFMGRIHNAKDFVENYWEARACNFANINVDLMFAIPGQTLQIWDNTLSEVLSLKPEHISFYSLQLEEGTPFYRMFEEGNLNYIDDQTDRRMYREAIAKLERGGYVQYEISNAARPGFECKHNLKYWSMDEYLGLGLGAHSYINGWRFSNETDLVSYMDLGHQLTKQSNEKQRNLHNSPFVVWENENTRQDDISEYLFTGMRQIEGISLDHFQRKFGVPILEIYASEISKHIKAGLLKNDLSNGRLRFSDKGIDLSNSVLKDFV